MLEQLSISQHVTLHPVRKLNIGYGQEAVDKTIKLMIEVIKQSERNYYVRRFAEYIISDVPKNNMLRVEEIYNFLKANTQYTYDPRGFEFIKTPPVSLQLIEAGGTPMLDCDDYTVLSLSLLRSLGYQVAIRVSGYSDDKKYTHVYGMVKINGVWYALDVTGKHGLGWEASGATIKKDYIVR